MNNRRKLVWARSSQISALTAAADAEVVDVLATFRTLMGITANIPGTTVVRTRMDLFAANLAAGGFPTYVGLKVNTLREVAEAQADAAFALNSGPQIETNADWFYWRALYPNMGADPTIGTANHISFELDIKSMRRLDEPSETVGLWVQKPVSTAGYSVYSTTSILLALP